LAVSVSLRMKATPLRARAWKTSFSASCGVVA
jgi:hypothetical protein